ncbi:hypothetical protein GCM10025857_42910 [Alicyclobacillus contaminans]|uniref:Transposase InsH N-terminal domain-containing protein n=1 Tax=Tetragenococcus osmophilus TaxID=526944 RepID=A0AA38CZW1_9ENTE|nr:transposase [Tetragenococcus osmophilus]GMA44365.1 hypothetical protein GCM10025853_18220 [Tetragenococcus halophilus subsp. halophilus DSM 20339]GMA52934.1 hypothetical protein GCM10025857_42910 [Alicyclobacillus contaminans]GMA73077.1 hypothetical protein GCM10025885_21260 [Tetragenococcus osmophilus]
MYKITEMSQISFYDFNQAYGFALDSKNEWIQRAELIPWHTLERSYARMFPAKVGNVAKPLRMVLGALIIQAKKQLSDAKLVQELTENPYLQFFIGLPAFQSKKPFDSSSLVGFRKRLNVAFMQEANALILSALEEVNDGAPLPVETKENVGTEILDATCAPSNVRFPRDTSLLNEARTQLEGMIDWFHKQYGFEKSHGPIVEWPTKNIWLLPKPNVPERKNPSHRTKATGLCGARSALSSGLHARRLCLGA